MARYVVNEHWSTALVNEQSGHAAKPYIYPINQIKWLNMWSMSTLIMVIRLEVPLYARLVPDVLLLKYKKPGEALFPPL